MAGQPGVHDELVLIDQSQLRERQRELHARHVQSPARLLLELLNGLRKIAAHELGAAARFQLTVIDSELEALKHKRVFCIPEAHLGRPGPRLVEGYRSLKRIVEACTAAD